MRQEEGCRRLETGDRRQETGDRRQETGDRRQNTAFRIPNSEFPLPLIYPSIPPLPKLPQALCPGIPAHEDFCESLRMVTQCSVGLLFHHVGDDDATT